MAFVISGIILGIGLFFGVLYIVVRLAIHDGLRAGVQKLKEDEVVKKLLFQLNAASDTLPNHWSSLLAHLETIETLLREVGRGFIALEITAKTKRQDWAVAFRAFRECQNSYVDTYASLLMLDVIQPPTDGQVIVRVVFLGLMSVETMPLVKGIIKYHGYTILKVAQWIQDPAIK